MPIILEAADATQREISRDAAKLAKTVEDLLECMGAGITEGDAPIPLPNVATGQLLTLLVDFLEEYHQKVIVPSNPEQLKALTERFHKKLYEESEDDWVKKYTDIKLADGKQDWETHFALAEVGNFVHAQTLMEVMSRKVAETIQGKTPDQLREEFRVPKKTETTETTPMETEASTEEVTA